jgi:uncharacterized protein
MDLLQLALLAAAGVVAGGVNAIAGGGSLLLFPMIVAFGLPTITASVTNTVSITGGYLASVAGSRPDLVGQGGRLWWLMPTVAAGTVTGAVLLLHTPAKAFELVAPVLVLAASLLLAFQERVSALVGQPHGQPGWLRFAMLFAVGVYGGYFIVVLGVVLMAVLGLLINDELRRIAGLKNVLQATVGVLATVMFALFGPVNWAVVALLIPATLTGGFLGARLGRRLPAVALRRAIVVIGVTVSGVLLVRALT